MTMVARDENLKDKQISISVLKLIPSPRFLNPE